MGARDVCVHLVPELVEAARFEGSIAVVIDVLRATTTIVHALAAGCSAVRPCLEVEEALALAAIFPAGSCLLGGERGGVTIPGFDLGNSPREYTGKKCKSKTLILTTSNGTRAIHKAAAAERLLIAGFTNFSAVCEQLRHATGPVHILCAGSAGAPCMEDTLLAGALVDFFCEEMDARLNDSARIAWDCYENHGRILLGALQLSEAGEHLTAIGHAGDIALAADVDKFAIVAERLLDPLRLEVTSAGIVKRRGSK